MNTDATLKTIYILNQVRVCQSVRATVLKGLSISSSLPPSPTFGRSIKEMDRQTDSLTYVKTGEMKIIGYFNLGRDAQWHIGPTS